jgi:hypothetical protein
MRHIFCSLLFSLSFYGLQLSARAQDTVIPAGTLIRCTVNEPDFSSATASVGDPVVCHLSSLQMYGHNVFPRGSYLGGHLEAAKEPGHFVGKGYLQLTFDRIGFPSSDIPVPGKVIAAKGYKVDRNGDIKGRGHATRDAVEWLIPPLWPWKIITLPARGPRPTLKGEEQITLRLMDDIVIPRSTTSYDRPSAYFRPQTSYDRPPASYRSQSYDGLPASNAPSTTIFTKSEVAPSSLTAENHLGVQGTFATEPVAVDLPSVPRQDRQHLTLIALKSSNTFTVTNYRVDNGSLNYVLSTGAEGSVDTREVDWRRTSQLNAPRNAVSAPGPVQRVF